jgi:NitT/TauT family transport system permease protein
MILRTSLARTIPPLLTVGALLATWHLLIVIARLPAYLLPPIWMVADRLYDGVVLGGMLPQLAWTVGIACAGYLTAAIAALAVAVLLSESQVIDALVFPLISGFQAIPKVALAPLLLIWLGYGRTSEVVLVALIAFFPIFSGALIGFRSVDRRLIELLRICHANWWFKFWHLALPGAAGQIFIGLQVSIGFSLVGCVVVEFLVGTGGIGFLIQNSANTLDTASGVAAMLLLAAIGAIAALSVKAIRHRVVFWEPAEDDNLRSKGGAS